MAQERATVSGGSNATERPARRALAREVLWFWASLATAIVSLGMAWKRLAALPAADVASWASLVGWLILLAASLLVSGRIVVRQGEIAERLRSRPPESRARFSAPHRSPIGGHHPKG